MDSKSMPYHDLLRALAEPVESSYGGCAVCQLVHTSLLAWLEDLIYSFGVDPEVRRHMRNARGLCNRHAHLLPHVPGAPLGVSLIHWDVIDTVVEEIERWMGNPQPSGASLVGGGKPDRRVGLSASPMERLRRRAGPVSGSDFIQAALAPRRSCMACDHQETVETLYLQILLRHLDDSSLRAAFEASPGLCLPHFKQAASFAQDRVALRDLAAIEMACLKRLSGELQELARKYDHRYAQEPVGEEADAWRRSLGQVAAGPGLR